VLLAGLGVMGLIAAGGLYCFPSSKLGTGLGARSLLAGLALLVVARLRAKA
jgi:hypothetical protein